MRQGTPRMSCSDGVECRLNADLPGDVPSLTLSASKTPYDMWNPHWNGFISINWPLFICARLW